MSISLFNIQRTKPYRLGSRAGLACAFAAGFLFASTGCFARENATLVPPLQDAAAAPESGQKTVVLAGGCFWGVQGVFQHVKGVTQAVSGYAGGTVPDPAYEMVSSGETGHAESVRITYDPQQISFATLLRVFFSVALDPTQRDAQGPDVGTQYRSAIFATTEEQKQTAQHYISELDAAHVFSRPIVTEVGMGAPFYKAESYHQDYATLHPQQPYIAYNDLPKIENLKRLFPDLYRSDPVLVDPSHARVVGD